MFGFLTLNMPYMPEYEEILVRLQTGDQKFIDVGCCFGQEIRKLVRHITFSREFLLIRSMRNVNFDEKITGF